MNHYIQLKKSNCKNCYKCIRHCPVKSIRFADQQAHIVKEQCILCGECFVACPQNAKQIRNDVDQVKEMIATGKPVYVSLAPSFIANYEGSDIHTLQAALIQLGFTGVEETAIGATIVKQEYEKILQSGEQRIILSSCCHTVNTLIQKYYPEVLPYLAKVMSPMQAHCSMIKQRHPGAYTVFIGPCISKKEEADQYPGIVDCTLTFEELTAWLEKEQITLPTTPYGKKQSIGKARLFPLPGGILRSMNLTDENYDYIAIDGIANCIDGIKNIMNGNLTHCFVEMSACSGSCSGGPAMDKKHSMLLSDYIQINRYAGEQDFILPPQLNLNTEKHFAFSSSNLKMPGSIAINEILHKMGKSSPQQELNCGSCGYSTCRDKAIAVYQGKADLTMCLPYLKEKAETFSDNILYNTPNSIMVLNEDLEIQQINRAAKSLLNIRHEGDILNQPVMRLLNPTIYLQVMANGKNVHDNLTYLDDYGKYVEETILYDKTYHIIISIMKDVTVEEKSRIKKESLNRQAVEITDKVIEKQMRVVQEIASLLGETTAETKIALTNLKESLNNE